MGYGLGLECLILVRGEGYVTICGVKFEWKV